MNIIVEGEASQSITSLIVNAAEWGLNELLGKQIAAEISLSVQLQGLIDGGNTHGYLSIIPEGLLGKKRREFKISLVYPIQPHILKEVLFHELTHLKQLVTGELMIAGFRHPSHPTTKSVWVWKDKFVCTNDQMIGTDNRINENTIDPTQLPWEKEAIANEKTLSNKFNEFKRLTIR